MMIKSWGAEAMSCGRNSPPVEFCPCNWYPQLLTRTGPSFVVKISSAEAKGMKIRARSNVIRSDRCFVEGIRVLRFVVGMGLIIGCCLSFVSLRYSVALVIGDYGMGSFGMGWWWVFYCDIGRNMRKILVKIMLMNEMKSE